MPISGILDGILPMFGILKITKDDRGGGGLRRPKKGEKNLVGKNVWSEKIFGRKKCLVRKNFWSEKNVGSDKNLGGKTFFG